MFLNSKMSKMHVNHSHVANGGLRKKLYTVAAPRAEQLFFFLLVKKFFQAITNYFRCNVDIRYSSSKGQAVKQTFFAPCSRIN